MTPQKNRAIQTALTGNWELAISINEEILQENPEDIETLNRLAFAYTVVGKIKNAKQAYQHVLEIDIFNPIAIKNLKRLGSDFTPGKNVHGFQLGENMFLEESGKTRIITLINTAQPKLIKTLQVGQPLHLTIKRLKIFVLDDYNTYIGMLPDNIGKRLLKFLKGGNLYDAYIKSIDNTTVTVFIREKKRASTFKNLSSFLTMEKITNPGKTVKTKHHSVPESNDDGA